MDPSADGSDVPTGLPFFDPTLTLVAVEDNESSDEDDVHDHHDDHGGYDGAVWTANVFWIASIFHCNIK